MKKLIIFFLLISSTCFSQIIVPVTWETSVEKISETEYNLVFNATIKKDWHLYALNVPENGPLPTVFGFDKNPNYTVIGNMSQEKGTTVYEEVFDMNVTYFTNKTTFKQHIKKINKSAFKLSGNIDYMACDSQQCVTDYYEFEIKI